MRMRDQGRGTRLARSRPDRCTWRIQSPASTADGDVLVLRLPPRVVCLPSGSTESKSKSKVEAHRHLQHVADVQQDIYYASRS
jgi:hypothetical protein